MAGPLPSSVVWIVAAAAELTEPTTATASVIVIKSGRVISGAGLIQYLENEGIGRVSLRPIETVASPFLGAATNYLFGREALLPLQVEAEAD
jgi:hypothetical protein